MIRRIISVAMCVAICVAFILPCMAWGEEVVEVELTKEEAGEVRRTARPDVRENLQFTGHEDGMVLLEVPAGFISRLGIDVWMEFREVTAGDPQDPRQPALLSATRKIDQAKIKAGIDDDYNDPKMLEIFREVGMQAQKENMITIIVEGTVIDEKGEPLEGVKVSATKRILGEEGEWGYETKNVRFAEKVIDGEFRFKVEESESISLRFEKEGYHGARLSISRGTDREGMRARREGFLHSKDNRVLMQPIGDPDALTRYGAGLHFYTDGSGEAIDFDMVDQSSSQPAPYEFTVEMEDIRDLDEVAQAIPHGVSFVAATTPDGMIEISEDGPRVANEFVLRMHDPDGGFIPHASVDDNSPKGPRIFRSMREALDDGYQREWTVRYEETSARFHYFYFKSRGHYGKGRITRGVVPRDKSNARVGMRFMLQHNEGERGVVTP